jgi:C4-dicarboxylate transporter DctM subunit
MEVALLFAFVIGLMFIGVPIAVALGLSSVGFLLMYSDGSLASIAQTLFSAFDGHYTLLAIPFFILASTFMSTGGVARRIIRFSIACVGHFPAGWPSHRCLPACCLPRSRALRQQPSSPSAPS